MGTFRHLSFITSSRRLQVNQGRFYGRGEGYDTNGSKTANSVKINFVSLVRGQVVNSKKMVGYDNGEIFLTGKAVKIKSIPLCRRNQNYLLRSSIRGFRIAAAVYRRPGVSFSIAVSFILKSGDPMGLANGRAGRGTS